ncbi:uncharacterized protein CCR75_007854 [Bremia lactucae]|uniref:Uncharacterized protein n=1 Tax=Bremia lactucae TaxID=4779 RepID=A0A976IEM4_BRELC|nr:hypothetical protein CCR75_007969 [Bremia lactucae]TDH69077.1 hypothetical protein CCR75_009105 [Bremia lactucae]TDH69099.1 hypothetical protein CCR75_009244 [Bremia lactucae]TDH69105.1 hypothetical protein CCR75_009302 [Bremia lactucae]TDH72479.1 hypothetical protein CCR75_007854 [Bremia lactucae]
MRLHHILLASAVAVFSSRVLGAATQENRNLVAFDKLEGTADGPTDDDADVDADTTNKALQSGATSDPADSPAVSTTAVAGSKNEEINSILTRLQSDLLDLIGSDDGSKPVDPNPLGENGSKLTKLMNFSDPNFLKILKPLGLGGLIDGDLNVKQEPGAPTAPENPVAPATPEAPLADDTDRDELEAAVAAMIKKKKMQANGSDGPNDVDPTDPTLKKGLNDDETSGEDLLTTTKSSALPTDDDGPDSTYLSSIAKTPVVPTSSDEDNDDDINSLNPTLDKKTGVANTKSSDTGVKSPTTAGDGSGTDSDFDGKFDKLLQMSDSELDDLMTSDKNSSAAPYLAAAQKMLEPVESVPGENKTAKGEAYLSKLDSMLKLSDSQLDDMLDSMDITSLEGLKKVAGTKDVAVSETTTTSPNTAKTTPSSNTVSKSAPVLDDGQSDADVLFEKTPEKEDTLEVIPPAEESSYLKGLYALSDDDLKAPAPAPDTKSPPKTIDDNSKTEDSMSDVEDFDTSECPTGFFGHIKSWWKNTVGGGDKCALERRLRVVV